MEPIDNKPHTEWPFVHQSSFLHMTNMRHIRKGTVVTERLPNKERTDSGKSEFMPFQDQTLGFYPLNKWQQFTHE